MDEQLMMQLMSQGVNPNQQQAPQQAPNPWEAMSQQMKDLMYKTLNKERDRQWKDRMQAPAVQEVDGAIKQMGGY